MTTRNFLKWISMLSAAVVLVAGVDPGRAFAAGKTVPTCNGWTAATPTTPSVPQYVDPTGALASTTVCTDFFGKANYANSPLPTGPIDISAATATTAAGITLVDGGSGYKAPVVTVTDAFNSPTVVPASCSAVVDSTGNLTGIAGSISDITCIFGGSGYMAPVITITETAPGGTGTGAIAYAKLNAAGPFVGGMPKFVDTLPDLKSALAAPDKAKFPGSDYYEIALVETTTSLHSNLPPTTVRGYRQVPSGTANACSDTTSTPPYAFNYLGPVILAQRDVPVRVKFTNCLPAGAGGDLFIPTDTTYMGAGKGPDGTDYTENRATLHLHGGVTPWISDGTAHQWTVPVGETANLQRGVSTQMVPDMYFLNGKVVPQCSASVTTACSGGTAAQFPAGASNDPGQGSMSFYWTNQQSGRLMFYHDHAFGITRLNVYAGEAAGYLLYDPTEEAALQSLGVPGTVTAGDLEHIIPLVIQDKTFVPNQAQLAAQDPTWSWGHAPAATGNGNGDLWFPHVYMTNQNPFDPGGSNAFGRWDYGAWFYPAQTTLTAAGTGPSGIPGSAVTIPCTSASFPGQVLAPNAANNFLAGCPITPNPSGTPEGFMDTPVVNGKAYPVLHVKPEAYRFHILAAGNDRSWNLQLYATDPLGSQTEVPMVTAFPPYPGSPIPLCKTVNPLTTPSLGVGLPTALLDASGNPLNGTGLPAGCWPNYGAPSPGIYAKQYMWSADGRDGGVPDPRFAGPPIIEIGTEGGLLPAPVVIPSTPANYEVNVKSITVTNVSAHALWLGPAERADAIIDFSKFAGKTLILYNDAPTPAPAYDVRDDYYTGDVDETSTGGAPTTVPGYGPNTRTVMQIKVDVPVTTKQTPFNVAKLINGIPTAVPPLPGLAGIFKMTQPEIIVPEQTYPAASGGQAPATTYAKVQDTTMTYQPAGLPVVASINVTNGGTGYSAKTAVTIDAPACVAGPACFPATATATVTGGVISAIAVTNVGSGYSATPLVHISDPAPGTGSGASAVVSNVTQVSFEGKAIQELFTLDYGRMNATLGNELPLTNFLVQTTLPFGYSEWATEIIQADKPQIWYLTHNGVDTHFIHFHLFNVQVINRVGWDGTVRPPEQNELGWKDTVRMNQLENIIFAIKPITPQVPFPLPDSIRPMDPSMPLNVTDPAMSGIDPATGNAIVAAGGTTNSVVNFGHEYVWHCHILGHEENDMMRTMIYQVPPAAPTNLVATSTANGVSLSWTDNSASETEFAVQRDTVPTFDSPNLTPFTVNASSANTTGFSTLGYGQTVTLLDPSVVVGTTYYYRLLGTDDFADKSPLTAPFQTVAVSSAYVSALPITVLKTPTVTFTGAPGSAPFGASFNVTASTNSSSVPVITGTAGICSVVSSSGSAASTVATINMLSGTGTCILTASWAADATYSAALRTQTTSAALAVPTETFTGAPASAPFPGSFTVTATSNAGVAPSILGNATCSVGSVTGTSPATALITMSSGTGVCNLQANWPATTNYVAASLTQSTSTQVVITTTALPGGVTGSAYNQTLTATGATAPYTWTRTGAWPAGLTMSGAGVIRGTPSAAGTFNFNVTATAANGIFTAQALSITVTTPVSITPVTLPGAFTGSAYSQTLTATGGSTPFTWSISAGALPAGLALSAAGVISGTPTVTGTSNFTVKVAAGNGTSATLPLSITVTAPLTITTASLPGAVTGVAYSQTLTATGGSAPLTWSISAGALPTGLALSVAGIISGTPTVTGTSTFTVKVTAGNGATATLPLTITVTAPVSITTVSLPGAITGSAYSQTLTSAGGSTPYTWSISAGALPSGLGFSAAGVISGTPTLTGTSTFTVKVTAGNGTSATLQLSITDTAPVSITTASLPGAVTGVAYSQTLTAAGGSAPLTWSISAGTLPTGMTLSAAGVISGTATVTGTSSFTVKVAAGNGTSATLPLSITVTAPVSITTASLPGAITGSAYSQTLTSAGGSAPFTWSISAGALPAGLTLSAAGVINGTPTVTGTSTFTVKVTAGNGTSATLQLTITVTAPFSITTTSLPGGTLGTAYSQKLGATGAPTPYTWSVSAGALPTGLTLKTGGTISGTPTATGTFTFTVQVVAANGSTATQALSILIGAAVPAAPSNLTAVASGAQRITLTWTDNSSDETSFSIWRSDNGGTPVATTLTRTAAQMKSVGGTVTFNDKPVVTGTTYTYYVTAVNAAGASLPTATVTLTF
jgi:FtsP/CotA-like multicopper oxidase with cupredoxin domain